MRELKNGGLRALTPRVPDRLAQSVNGSDDGRCRMTSVFEPETCKRGPCGETGDAITLRRRAPIGHGSDCRRQNLTSGVQKFDLSGRTCCSRPPKQRVENTFETARGPQGCHVERKW